MGAPAKRLELTEGGVWKSRQALVSQVMTSIRHYNERTHPFNLAYKEKPLTAQVDIITRTPHEWLPTEQKIIVLPQNHIQLLGEVQMS